MQKYLGVFKLTSLGATYAAANLLFTNKELELIELSPLGEQGQIIASGSESALKQLRTLIRQADMVRSSIILDSDGRLLRAYLGLESQVIQKYLLIVESDFLGDLFEWSSAALEMGSSVFDIRLLRTHKSPSYAILTGGDTQQLEPLISQLKLNNKRVTLIEKPESGLIDFMSILP